MKRLVRCIGFGVAVTALSASPAYGGSPTPRDPFPEAKGWVALDEIFLLPAGFACDVAVNAHVVGHERITIDGEPVEGPPQPGDVVVNEGHQVVTLTNVETGKSIMKKTDGAVYERVRHNGTDLKSIGVGTILYVGPGITGLLWTKGVQRFNVYDFASPDSRTDMKSIKGKSVELCHWLGANPA